MKKFLFALQKETYQNLLTQILFDFGEFKGFALKNPTRGFAPRPHKPLKRLDRNF